MTDPQKGSTGVQFARPLEQSSQGAWLAGPRVSALPRSSTLVLGGLVILACATFLLQTRPDNAQNLPASAQKKNRPAARMRIALAEAADPVKSTQTARPSLDFYTKGVRGSMFSAPQPPKPKEAPAPKLTRVIVPVVKPVIPNPFADWTYAGSITVGDKKMALLENRITKEGHYVLEGQPFMGLAQVKNVTDQMVTIVSAGKPLYLAKSDTINVTPLSASAAYLTAQPQQAGQQMGQQAMMAMQGGQTGLSGPGMVLPNGRTLTADQAARFNSRMNRRFDGGQGGQGGQNGWQGGRGGQGGGGRRGGRGGAPGGIGGPQGG